MLKYDCYCRPGIETWIVVDRLFDSSAPSSSESRSVAESIWSGVSDCCQQNLQKLPALASLGMNSEDGMLARCLLAGDPGDEVRIFYSYSREDSVFRRDIDEVLSRFKWDVDVRSWYDGDIPAGTEWENEIFRNIDAAHIILLFLTRHFISSPYCHDIELPRALARQERGEARVIPILVEDIDSDEIPASLKKLQYLPRNGLPVNAWADRSEAIRKVVQGIVDIIANAHVDPALRCRWRVRLEPDDHEFDDHFQLRIIQDLRLQARDPSLRPLALSSGRTVLLLDSSHAGFANFKNSYREQEHPQVAGLCLREVVEIHGAGVQASATEITAGQDQDERHTDLLMFPSEAFVAPTIRAITIRDIEPLRPDFVINNGDLNLEGPQNAALGSRLIDYFLTSVRVPDEDQWVNLSPDESNRMLGERLAGTEMGKRLLELDLKLKRLAASLLHPDCDSGRSFWREVFARNRRGNGIERQELSMFQRVWLVPTEAVIYAPDKAEGQQTAYIVSSGIEVMCQDDYLSSYAGHGEQSGGVASDANDICTPAFNEIVLPVIDEEVSQGRSFSGFRELYSCMVLATWLKMNLDDHPAWRRYVDSEVELAHAVEGVGPSHLAGLLGLSDHSDRKTNGEASHEDTCGDKKTAETTSTFTQRMEDAIANAIKLREDARNKESLGLLQEVLRSVHRLGGPESRLAQSAIRQLGRTYHAMGQLEEAKQQYAELVRIQRLVLSNNHPSTIESMGILADTMEALDEMADARDLRDEIEYRKARTSGVFDIRENREFFEEYMRIFHHGVFRLKRDEFCHDEARSLRIVRSYFSGAMDLRSIPIRTLS